MRKKFKIFVFLLCKSLLLFSIAKYITRNKLRIICLHGFSLGDESQWQSGIIMDPDTLEKRIQYIKNNDYKIIPLEKAIHNLENKRITKNSVVITLDDGFRTTESIAHPILKKHDCPYTVYLTTYYCEKHIPIINLILSYALWKTKLHSYTTKKDGKFIHFNLNNTEQKKNLFTVKNKEIDGLQTTQEQKLALAAFLRDLQLDAEEILSRDTLKLLTAEQVKRLAAQGVDFQLHTHTHRFPSEKAQAIKELEKNSRWISEVTGKTPQHLCYPSGKYHLPHFKLLDNSGIKSATSCLKGLNGPKTNNLLLYRFLDDNALHPLEFEAFMSGFQSLLQFWKTWRSPQRAAV